MTSLPLLDAPVRPCVNCGYCCKKAPCPFGEGVPCIYLVQTNADTFLCGRYDYIKSLPANARADLSPAFGAGCCSPFNSDRQRKLQRMKGT